MDIYKTYVMRIIGGMLRLEICGMVYKTFILASLNQEMSSGFFELFRTRDRHYHSKYTYANEREFIQYLLSKGVSVLDDKNQDIHAFVTCKSCERIEHQEADAVLWEKKKELFHEQAEALYKAACSYNEELVE